MIIENGSLKKSPLSFVPQDIKFFLLQTLFLWNIGLKLYFHYIFSRATHYSKKSRRPFRDFIPVDGTKDFKNEYSHGLQPLLVPIRNINHIWRRWEVLVPLRDRQREALPARQGWAGHRTGVPLTSKGQEPEATSRISGYTTASLAR